MSQETEKEKGNISINTENIFPIIKKFLYSDHEIFLRELVSNAVDACQKIKRITALGESADPLGELKVSVSVDETAKTITISDNGLGMTADEIKKYINQIAFSGATEFVEKYKDKGDEKQIIGHFGLGFYSAFMVSDFVEIITKSFQTDSKAAKWSCTGNTEFEIVEADKTTRGTDIILHISEDSAEFLNNARVKGVLDKYCKFLPIPIEFEEKILNNPTPLWSKAPADLTKEDYLDFYKELYPYSMDEPLFWIHLNVDFPFNLTGVLYFPKISNKFEQNRNKIQLYSRQVFITDEVKDVVPEFLMLLHGVIDSPDIPLNVSRSYLQADANVKKINSYITKKVSDKLAELFKDDRPNFEAKWDSIGVFVKYGMITDEKFSERATSFCLLTNVENKQFTIEEYKNFIETNQKDKGGKSVVLFTNSPETQDTYISSARKRSYDVLKLDGVIDQHFVQVLEKKLENTDVKRVDADSIDKLIDKDIKVEISLSEDEQNTLRDAFKRVLGNDKLNVTVEALPTDELPVLLVMPEFMRRMQEMSEAQGMDMAMFGGSPQFNVIINGNHKLIHKILKTTETAANDALIRQIYDLALLSQNKLSGANLTAFITRSVLMCEV